MRSKWLFHDKKFVFKSWLLRIPLLAVLVLVEYRDPAGHGAVWPLVGGVAPRPGKLNRIDVVLKFGRFTDEFM